MGVCAIDGIINQPAAMAFTPERTCIFPASNENPVVLVELMRNQGDCAPIPQHETKTVGAGSMGSPLHLWSQAPAFGRKRKRQRALVRPITPHSLFRACFLLWVDPMLERALTCELASCLLGGGDGRQPSCSGCDWLGRWLQGAHGWAEAMVLNVVGTGGQMLQ